jgi:hypothetical protein
VIIIAVARMALPERNPEIEANIAMKSIEMKRVEATM